MGFFNELTAGTEIYVDLGTANTLVVDKVRGIVANEASVVAYRDMGQGRKSIIAVGNEAKAKLGKTPVNLHATFPLRDGVIADMDATEAMLRYFLSKAPPRFRWMRPRAVISLPYGVTDVEKKAVRQAGLACGCREVILIDEPMAAAIGSGLPVHAPKGSMVIDIGGGTTEIAVISLYGIVRCEAIRVAGNAFDRAIVDYMRRRHNMVVGDQSAERLKMEIGSAMPDTLDKRASIRGIDFSTRLPREIEISPQDIHDALKPSLKEIIEASRRVLEKLPPELVPDIMNDGVKIAGGGALLHGLAQRLSQELKIPVSVAPEPLLAIARGGGAAIRQPELLSRIARYQ